MTKGHGKAAENRCKSRRNPNDKGNRCFTIKGCERCGFAAKSESRRAKSQARYLSRMPKLDRYTM